MQEQVVLRVGGAYIQEQVVLRVGGAYIQEQVVHLGSCFFL